MTSEKVLAILVIISLLLPLASTPVAANVTNPCEGGEISTVTRQNSTFNTDIRYEFQFADEKNRLCVTVENHGDGKDLSSFTAIVDGKSAAPTMPTLEAGESVTVVKNITGYLDVRRDNHTVLIGTGGQETRYNFTQRSSSDNSTIPSPRITDVEVLRYESNDSTALRVETFNPSKRGYSFSVQVETFGTDGDFTIASPQENETSTVVLPLKESADDVVAGKVRIFGEFGQPETKFDQKEFMSESGDGTDYWDVEFDRVPGKVDTYSYSNQTARVKYQGYDEDLLTPLQKQIGAAAVVLLLVGTVWWRRRRKYR